MRIEIEVKLSDGRRLSSVCRGPKGIWGVPLDPRDHRAKLDDCLGRLLKPSESKEVLDLLENLEKLDTSGVGKIISLIAGTDHQP